MENGPKSEQFKEAAEAAAESLSEAGEEMQNRLGAFWEASKDKVSACAQATDRVIRDKPYQAIGIALVAGVLIGLLINRRGGED